VDRAQDQTATETKPLGRLTALQRDVLLVVARHDGDGGTTIVPAVQSFVDLEARDSVVYDNLSKLTEMGLISKQADGRERRYELTEQGKQTVNRLRDKIDSIQQ